MQFISENICLHMFSCIFISFVFLYKCCLISERTFISINWTPLALLCKVNGSFLKIILNTTSYCLVFIPIKSPQVFWFSHIFTMSVFCFSELTYPMGLSFSLWLCFGWFWTLWSVIICTGVFFCIMLTQYRPSS